MTQITKSDVLQILETIRLTYDNAFAGKSENDMTVLVGIWYDCLSEYPKEVVFTALKSAIKHSEYVPKISTVVKEIEALIGSQQASDSELWNELLRAIEAVRIHLPYMCGAYDTVRHSDTGKTTAEEISELVRRTYAGLSPKVKEYCGNLRGFVDIAKQDDESLQFEKARFVKQSPALTERTKIKQQTPPQLTNLIKELCGSNGQRLLGGEYE